MLVGGEGTRLRPLTWTVPKQMLPVAGVPMLERVLSRLAAHGIDEAILSMGYRPDAFLQAYPEGRAAGVGLTYAVEPEPRDTAGAIRFAADAAGLRETFLVVNGDVLSDLDVSGLVAYHRSQGGLGTIALTPVEDPSAFGVVPTDATGRVEAFIEKPPPGQVPTNFVNAGFYVLEPEVLDLISPEGRVSVEKETFPALVDRGALYALGSDAYWIDTGTPALFIQASLDIVSGSRGGQAPLPGLRALGPGQWLGPGTRIEGDLLGPALVEAGASVGSGATVSSSLIGPGASIGSGALVEGSVVLGEASIDDGARVSGSIIGRGARIGRQADVDPVSVVGYGARVPPGTTLEGVRFPDAAPLV